MTTISKSYRYDMGRPNALTMEEEKDIVRCCEVLGRVGVCTNRHNHRLSWSFILAQPFPAWRNFLKRWPELTERKPEHLIVQRAKATSPSVVDAFYSNLTNLSDFQASKCLSS